jgi:hypothetical protein
VKTGKAEIEEDTQRTMAHPQHLNHLHCIPHIALLRHSDTLTMQAHLPFHFTQTTTVITIVRIITITNPLILFCITNSLPIILLPISILPSISLSLLLQYKNHFSHLLINLSLPTENHTFKSVLFLLRLITQEGDFLILFISATTVQILTIKTLSRVVFRPSLDLILMAN